MGYYTYYDLSYDDDTVTEEEIIAVLKEDSTLGFNRNITSLAELCYDSMTWYDHDIDMLELSKVFPKITFILDGSGEESGDIWRTYYKNGKAFHSQAQIIFAEPPKDFFN